MEEEKKFENHEKKVEIQNRNGEKIFAVVREAPQSKGFLIISPGWGGNKEQPQLVALSDTAFNNGYTSVRFDQTNNAGESDGIYEQGTVTGYKNDLEDILGWAKTQPWYREPIITAGHSLGGMATLLHAEQYTGIIKGVISIGSPLSGNRFKQNRPDEFAEWQRKGFITRKVGDKQKTVPFSHMQDRLRYDVLADVEALKDTPTLLIVGEKDASSPPSDQADLARHLPKSSLVVIPGAEHTFRQSEEIALLKKNFDSWLHQI